MKIKKLFKESIDHFWVALMFAVPTVLCSLWKSPLVIYIANYCVIFSILFATFATRFLDEKYRQNAILEAILLELNEIKNKKDSKYD